MQEQQTAETIQFDDFARLDLRIAKIVGCEPHPNADRLLKIQLDMGNGQTRQICAGLRQHYQPDDLIGKLVVVVANLAPRTMRGERSEGMMLAARAQGDERVIFIAPSEEIAPGAEVS
ncbi:MAG: methionine--tRNA ligase subunit beta [Phycisphaerae bacterium]